MILQTILFPWNALQKRGALLENEKWKLQRTPPISYCLPDWGGMEPAQKPELWEFPYGPHGQWPQSKLRSWPHTARFLQGELDASLVSLSRVKNNKGEIPTNPERAPAVCLAQFISPPTPITTKKHLMRRQHDGIKLKSRKSRFKCDLEQFTSLDLSFSICKSEGIGLKGLWRRNRWSRHR